MVQHPDPDDLTMLALGEQIDIAVEGHLDRCEQCRAEVDAMRMTVELAELSNYGEATRQPGEHIWDAIVAELGVDAAPRTNGSAQAGTDHVIGLDSEIVADGQFRSDTVPGTGPPDSSPPVNLRPVPDTGRDSTEEREAAGALAPGTGADSRTSPVAPRRWSRWVAPLAALIVGAALGAGALVLAQNRSDSVIIDATAPLTAVPKGPVAGRPGQLGQAELVSTNQGQQVRVTAPALPSMPGTSYEVWLFDGHGGMVSLGSLDDNQGQFTVPSDINTQEYRTVDVSDEPPDGNPAHSGISMVRGSFS